MADALTGMMLSMLGLSSGRHAEDENNQKAKPDDDDDNAMLAMPIEEVVAQPVPEQPATNRRERSKDIATETIDVVNPKTASRMSDGSPEEKNPEPKRRRHRQDSRSRSRSER
jgi:hypothetical protein